MIHGLIHSGEWDGLTLGYGDRDGPMVEVSGESTIGVGTDGIAGIMVGPITMVSTTDCGSTIISTEEM